MRTIATLILLCVCMASCSVDQPPAQSQDSVAVVGYAPLNVKLASDAYTPGMVVYVIDSCEYIGNGTQSNAALLTHKGNCRFCAERNRPDTVWVEK